MRNQIQQVIKEYNDKLEQVKANRDYSATGREKAIQRIQEEKAEALKAFVPALRKQAIKAGLEATSHQSCAWASGQLDADQWDYSRLSYEAAAAKSQVKRLGGNVYDVVRAWEQVKNSADKYKIKAFIDSVPAEIEKPKYDHATFDNLMQDMSAHSNIFEKSSLTAGYEQSAQKYKAEIGELAQLAGMIDEEVYNNGMRTNPVAQKQILQGMHFEDDGKLKLDFEKGKNETDDQLFNRLEQDRAAYLAQAQEVGKKFGVQITEADL